jgi:AraC family ethanolamine operon transcriptional activator
VTAVSVSNGNRQPPSPAPGEPILFMPGIGGTIRTTDVDRLHDLAPGWVEQSFQLGNGPFQGSLSFGQTARMQFAHKDWTPGLLVRGSAPAGSVVLGFPLVDSTGGRLRGLTLGSSDFGYIGRDEEVDFRSTTPYRLFVIAMEEEQLEAYAQAVLGRPLSSLVRAHRLRGERPVEDRNQGVERLGLDAVYRSAQRLTDPQVASWVENRILDSLLSGLSCGGRTHAAGGAGLARRAEDYLLTNLQAPLTISDLCTAMRASERTLHQAFKVHLGTTPKAHLKALRLNAVRRELRRAGPGVGVMDVAMRWGFFHAGWLSQDYRRMFGESPSRTLPAQDTSAAGFTASAGSR